MRSFTGTGGSSARPPLATAATNVEVSTASTTQTARTVSIMRMIVGPGIDGPGTGSRRHAVPQATVR
jgi:hypothetical protein